MPSSSLPSYDRALQLLEESGCSDGLIRHVEAVSKYAVEVAESLADADVALVQIGGLLHDIGRCKTHGIEHGIVGGKLLRSFGVDERVANIAEKHVGAGITEKEAVRLCLPPGSYIPETLEEKIVAAADNLKLLVGIGRSKAQADKRASIAKRDAERDMARAMARGRAPERRPATRGWWGTATWAIRQPAYRAL